MTVPIRSNLRSPRVAFFTDSFHEANGVALTSREFAKFAKSRFFPFFSVHAGKATHHWRRGSFQTYELGMSKARLGLEHDLAFDLLFFRHLRNLETALRAFEPDLVHVTGPGHIGLLGAILAHRLSVPLVASWHTNIHEFGARRLEKALAVAPSFVRTNLSRLAERKSLDLAVCFYQLARIIFAPNPELSAVLGARCGRPVHAMHRGIDCHLYNPARRLAAGTRFVIGYVGRISAEKNVRILAAVEDVLRARSLTDYEFRIVGDGSERPWLERHLVRATFLGVLKGEDLADAYAQMDVLLFPSETDTFGNVALEAAASGVPALVSAAGGPKYLVEDGITGFVATGPKQYADAILALRDAPDLRARMGAAARSSAQLRSWDAVFEGIYEQYRDGQTSGLLASRRRVPLETNKTFRTRPVSS